MLSVGLGRLTGLLHTLRVVQAEILDLVEYRHALLIKVLCLRWVVREDS